MSEKFGLDWKKYDARRMDCFLRIACFEGEKAQKEMKKRKGKDQPKFRKRGG